MNPGLLCCIKSADKSGILTQENGNSGNVGTGGGTGGFTAASSLPLSPLTPGHPESLQSRLMCACRSEEGEAGSVMTVNFQERWAGQRSWSRQRDGGVRKESFAAAGFVLA